MKRMSRCSILVFGSFAQMLFGLSHRPALVFLVVLCSFGVAKSSQAQLMYPIEQPRKMTPASPTLSPYLDLLRNDNSQLSPYHSFVLPRRQIIQQQLQTSGEVQRLQGEFSRSSRPSQPTYQSRRPTGNAASFQSYLHFYNFGASNFRSNAR